MKTLNYWLIKKELWKVALVMGLVILPASLYQRGSIAVGKVEAYQEVRQSDQKRIEELARENEQLKIQARVASSNSESPKLNEGQVRTLASLVISKKADLDRFMQIITTCENSTLDPKRVNVNKNGAGYDLGVAQVNSLWHSKRVQEMFGEGFDSAMGDSAKNILYAGYIYQTQGGFQAWSCERIVPKLAQK